MTQLRDAMTKALTTETVRHRHSATLQGASVVSVLPRDALRFLIASILVAIAVFGCGNSDRRAEFRLAPDTLAPTPVPEIARQRVRKRLAEVADLLGFDEKRELQDPVAIAVFSQPVKQAPVEIKAFVQGSMILVEVSQQKPMTSKAALFEKAKALVEDRLRADFADRVSETSTTNGWWSFIRSEDAGRSHL